MALFLTEQDVLDLLPMERALERIEWTFREQHRGEAVNRSRERIFLPHSSLHYMAAALPAEDLLGMKIYTVTREALRFLVLLYHATTGALLAILEADQLGRIRTGAASGVATKYLARADSERVGLIGAGRQAETQLAAIALVSPLKGVKVYSREEARRGEFCQRMSARLRLEVAPAHSAEEAARFGDIVVTATTASQPVLHGDWLRPGTHVNAIGANMLSRRELDSSVLGRASLIAVDTLEQAREEAGDLVQGLEAIRDGWQGVVELHEVVAGRRRRTSSDEITLFKSSGIALWDVAVAGYVYRQAVRAGRGREFKVWGEP